MDSLSVAQTASTIPHVTTDIVVVLGLVLLALILFAAELIAIDLTAILMMVLVIVLQPWTHLSVQEGISGFSSTAAVAVIALLIVSAGLERTGVVQMAGQRMASFAGTDTTKQLAVTTGVAGSISGFIGDTPVVAILLPVTTNLARKGRTSASKLLMPLSFAAMLGGTLTLFGTGTNLLASDASARLLNHPFSVFEFTQLGILVLVTGVLYLVTVGHRLLPERVPPAEDAIDSDRDEDEYSEYRSEIVVGENAPITDLPAEEAREVSGFELGLSGITRGDKTFTEPFAGTRIRAGDVLTVQTDRETLEELQNIPGLTFAGTSDTEVATRPDGSGQSLVEAIIPSGSVLIGDSLSNLRFHEQYNASVLALRLRENFVRKRLDDLRFRVGDILLLRTPTENIDRLSRDRDLIIAQEPDEPDYRTAKIPLAVGIMVGMVALPALNIVSIVVSAYAAVILMVVTGILKSHEIYDAVPWDVIFLLAGIYPLGLALEPHFQYLLRSRDSFFDISVIQHYISWVEIP